MDVGGQSHASAALPPSMARLPLYTRLGGPQGLSGRARKISPQLGFDSLTFQPVASRYTDLAIPAHDVLSFSKVKSIHIMVKLSSSGSITSLQEGKQCDHSFQ